MQFGKTSKLVQIKVHEIPKSTDWTVKLLEGFLLLLGLNIDRNSGYSLRGFLSFSGGGGFSAVVNYGKHDRLLVLF